MKNAISLLKALESIDLADLTQTLRFANNTALMSYYAQINGSGFLSQTAFPQNGVKKLTVKRIGNKASGVCGISNAKMKKGVRDEGNKAAQHQKGFRQPLGHHLGRVRPTQKTNQFSQRNHERNNDDANL